VRGLWLLVGLLLLTSRAHATDTSKAVIGTTPAAIHSRFPGVIHAHLASRAGAARLAKLSAVELQDLTYAYARNTGGNTTDLVNLAAVYAPTQLPRLKLAAANAYQAYFYPTVSTANSKLAVRMKLGAGPAPTLDMTLEEIYLEFRTAPVGALSVEASIYSTASYAMINLTAAWSAGYIIGSGIHWLIETYAPSLDNLIGATLDGCLTGLANSTVAMQGWWNYHLDLDVFGVSIYDLGWNNVDLGDFGLFDDMISFMFDFNLCINPGDC
jgi:hypothetical protein